MFPSCSTFEIGDPVKISSLCLTLIALSCIALCFAPQHACGSDESTNLRRSSLYRGLTSKSETTRLRTILNCRRESIHLKNELTVLGAAAREAITEAESENNLRTSTSQLLYLIGTVHEPEIEAVLIEALASPYLGIRMLATDVLGQNRFHGSIEDLKQQVSCPEYKAMYGFRFNLLRAFTQMKHPDAIDFLTALYPRLDGQLRHLIGTALDAVTVDDFMGDEQRFAEWQAARVGPENKDPDPKADKDPDRIVFKPAGYESEAMNRIKFAKSQYYGINIHAKRIMFIIDHSGSMEEPAPGGVNRLTRAKLELIKVIRELPEETEFALMFYETNVRFWRKELVLANQENKLEAIAFVRRLGFGDRTNTYGALRGSLTFDDDLETVFMLTDGKPTIGATVQPAKILEDILGRNRFRNLNYNTIGIAVNPATEAFLKQLAVGSGGEYRRAF